MSDNSKSLLLEMEWQSNPRWAGITRPYSGTDVLRLRGSIQIEHTLARIGAERLWSLLDSEDYVAALGAMTGKPGCATGECGPEGDLHQWMAGGSGC